MKKTPRSIPTKRRSATVILALTVIVGAIILLLLKNSDFDNKKTIPAANSSEQNASTTSTLSPLPPPTMLPALPPEAPLLPATMTAIPQKTTTCQDTATKLQTLFQHLDQQKYIQAYTQDEPAAAELNRIATKILSNPPTNSNETADLLSVIKNSSHLFRLLGRKDLSFLKDIITNEQPSIEQHFASLYAWSTMDKACRDASTIKLEFPLAKTYEYAAFFLNTLGGQSYLSRRDIALRTLTKYYCVLILDQAASQSMNIYNINLAYHLDSVTNDLENGDFFKNQSAYLATLKNIKNTLHRNQKL